MARPKIAGYVKRRINIHRLGTSSRRLLCLLEERGTLSQGEAARILGLSGGTCNLHFQHLEHEGLVRRIDRLREARGRPTIVWGIDDVHNGCVSVVFDVPYFQASLLDFGGDVLHETRADLSSLTGQAQILERMDTFLREAARIASRRRGRIRQVFAAVPGLLDPVSGKVRTAVNFPLLDGIDLKSHVEGEHGLPCFAGSLGLPFYYGESERLPEHTTAMVIHWDLGVGVVFGRDRRVLPILGVADGGRERIAEIGHVRIVAGGRRCSCGGLGCLEAYTGGAALLSDLGLSALNELLSRAAAGDRATLEAAARAARCLGENLVWPLQVMGAQRIIVTGPMAPVFARVRDAFSEGLAKALSREEIARLAPEASTDALAHLQRGGYLLAKRIFFHPEEAGRLPQAPQSLTR